MPLDPRLRCSACGRPLAQERGRLVCAGQDCPLKGMDQESCCGGAPLQEGRTPPPDACPAPRIAWVPDEE